MPVSPSDKSHGTQAVHQCANKSSAHVDDHKCDDTGTPSSEQNVARKPEASKQHHSPLAGKSNKGSRAFRPRLDQGVTTGTLPVQQHQQHHLHNHLQQQHIVHCQFHRPCIANLQYGDGAAAAFAHPLHQHAYPVWDSRCVASPNLDLRAFHQPQPQTLLPAPHKAGRPFLPTGKHSLLNRNGLVAIPETQVYNCTSSTSGWDSSPSDWQEQSELFVQDNSILDYRLGKPFIGTKPKNGHRKSLSQLNRTPKKGLLSDCGDLKINKITLLKKKSEPDPQPSSDCDPLAAKGSGAKSPGSGCIPSLSASESELFSGADYTLVGSQDIDSWLDSNPDFWEEIREPQLDDSGELSDEHSGNSKRKISNCEEKPDKQKEGRIAKRTCDSLLNSGSYSSEDLPQAEPRTQRSRRIRNSSRNRSNIQSEDEKYKGCVTKPVERETEKKTQRLTFQWTDFDIDASLEFITGVTESESYNHVESDSTMVAKSQESSDSKGEFQFQIFKFFCHVILLKQHTASNTLSW